MIILFRNELITLFTNSNCPGIYIDEQVPNIISLMFADDIENVTDTVGRLRKHIVKIKCKYSKCWSIWENVAGIPCM